ncbi:MAG: sulfite exporter TauE/SafE family protein [Bacteroidota bacterium]
MELIIISVVALLASLMTFFSGFGLGTILTPVFILFFPVDVAIALTGIVHLLNNFFKISLVGKQINWPVGLRFGCTAIVGAFIGARLLLMVADSVPLYSYSINDKLFFITPVKLIVAVLMIVFSLFEVIPALAKIQVDRNKLYIGGLISGFFGGLSGNQGALRSMFLIRSGLTKESFIATGILIACFVDLTRLTVYFNRMSDIDIRSNLTVLIIAILSAFAGAFIGSKLLKKVTLSFVQIAVTVMIVLLAVALGTGLL